VRAQAPQVRQVIALQQAQSRGKLPTHHPVHTLLLSQQVSPVFQQWELAVGAAGTPALVLAVVAVQACHTTTILQ
jgi:hypothetical protein